MKRYLSVFLFLILFSGCGTFSQQAIKQVAAPIPVALGGEKLVLIPGYGPESEKKMEFLQNSIGGIIVKPAKNYFLVEDAADDLFRQLKPLKLKKIQLIGYSWGGIIARRFIEKYGQEIEVEKIILIGTPNGGYWMMPKFVRNFLISQNPAGVSVFVIAGNKTAKKWYLRSLNDGKVDLESALDVKAEEKLIFLLDHTELINNEVVIKKVLEWLKSP